MIHIIFLSLLSLANYTYTAEYVQLPDLNGLMQIHTTLNNTDNISVLERAVFIDIANKQISRSNFEKSINEIIVTNQYALLKYNLMSHPEFATRAKTTLLSLNNKSSKKWFECFRSLFKALKS
ncbi:hypothetical protein KBD08_02360 [Candidatus Babeliales bacterium]|nr:hypothetical protein [Candidatus Babeliales bacterium]